jgi:hypothetical protein
VFRDVLSETYFKFESFGQNIFVLKNELNSLIDAQKAKEL